MTLVDRTPEAGAWLDDTSSRFQAMGNYGKILIATLWSDEKGEDGKPVVDIDPDYIVIQICSGQFPLLLDHDPGHPLGRILEAKKFTTPDGVDFIAGVLGLYAGQRLSFEDLRLYSYEGCFQSINTQPLPEQCWILLSADPRDVTSQWVQDVISNTPIPVKAQQASYNAKTSRAQLIRIGLAFTALSWNPYTSVIASEAAKDTYTAIKNSLLVLVKKVSELDNPIMEIKSSHNGCQVSFIVRGRDIQTNYEAMETLSHASLQADRLISNLKANGKVVIEIAYEYDKDSKRWYPSFAILADGTFITDNQKLIISEELPSGLSLGITSSRP